MAFGLSNRNCARISVHICCAIDQSAFRWHWFLTYKCARDSSHIAKTHYLPSAFSGPKWFFMHTHFFFQPKITLYIARLPENCGKLIGIFFKFSLTTSWGWLIFFLCVLLFACKITANFVSAVINGFLSFVNVEVFFFETERKREKELLMKRTIRINFVEAAV